MARIAGVDLPRDKRIEIALTYIYGIGLTTSQRLLKETGINPDTRARDLTEDEVVKLRDIIDKQQYHQRRSLSRNRHSSARHRLRMGRHQGIHHPRGRRSFPDGTQKCRRRRTPQQRR